MLIDPPRNQFFLVTLIISGLLHGGAAWYGWTLDDVTAARLLPFNKAVATVSLRRTTTKQQPVTPPKFAPPPPRPLPRESMIPSPIKRAAAKVPVPKPLIEPPKLERPMPEQMAHHQPPDRVLLDEIPPPMPPDPMVQQAEREQAESSESTGVATTPAAARYNPPPRVNPRHLRFLDESLEVALTIGVDGRATAYRILDSSGLDEADSELAKFVLENWLFDPATRGGRPIAVTQPVVVNIPRR